jgi:hypothetical protein
MTAGFVGTTKEFRMPQKFIHGPGAARIRHDAHLWIRPDIARWMKPGVDPADVFPSLARDRAQKEAAKERARAAEDAAFDAAIEHERRVLAAMREELNEIKAELARRRRLAEQTKYSPDQPRIPKRNPGGGQWTRDGGGSGQSPSTNIAKPMGNVDVGAGSSETERLFDVGPGASRRDAAQVAGTVIRVCTVTGAGRSTVGGVKTHFVIYECFGGRTFRVDGTGHNFPGVVVDRFR